MERLDYFGREISIRFKGFKTHKTKCGMMLTLTIISIIVVRISYLINNFVIGNTPTVLFQERQAMNPKRFNINPSTFSMAFGVLSSDHTYFVDNSILTIQSFIETKTTTINEQTQERQDVWKTQDIIMEKCTKEHVIDDEELSKEFPFLDSHFCFPKNMPLFIEGEYHQDSFAQIYILVKRCRGPQCKDEQTIQKALDLFWGEVIFTDVYVSPENKENPFTKYVRDTFWEVSQKLPKRVYMMFRNNFVESDYGFFLSDIYTDSYPSFSQTEEKITNSSDDIYSTFVLRFEKKKENLYKRSYRNFLSIVSELGGLLQVLTTIGILTTYYYTQTHLNQELINNTFTFQEQRKEEKLEMNQSKSQNLSNSRLKPQQLYIPQQRSNCDQAQQSKEPSMKTNAGSLSCNQLPQFKCNQSESAEGQYGKKLESTKLSFLKQESDIPEIIPERLIQKIANEQPQYYNKKQLNDEFVSEPSKNKSNPSKTKGNTKDKKVNFISEETINKNQNSMKFSLFNYFLSFFMRFGVFKKKKAIYDYSVQQLYNHLDVQWIINKLIEFDKLKRILLDDDQLLLFEYLPKPSICYSFKNGSVEFNDNQSFTVSKKSKNEKDNIERAYHSYKKLINKSNRQQVDSRILNYIDTIYKDIFQEEYQATQNQLQELKKLSSTEQPRQLSMVKQIKEDKLNEFDEIPQDCLVVGDLDQFHFEDDLKQYSAIYKNSPLQYPIHQQLQTKHCSLDFKI